MGLRVTDLTKGYTRRGEHHQALRGVSFEAPAGAFVTLLGPSGCGKSTLLNMLAGLDKPSGGRIDISGCTVYDSDGSVYVPAAGRNISMVFQSYAIWPHMTVRENVAFPLLNGRQRRRGRAELEQATDAALEKVHLAHLADRPAPLLSGGQQQRVALARAIAQSPNLIRSPTWTPICATRCRSRSGKSSAGRASRRSTSRTTRRKRWRCRTPSS